MNINVICIGGIKEKFYKDACNEYVKRLGRFGKIRVTELSEVRGQNGQDIGKEGKAVLKAIPKGSYIIALCVEGNKASSEKLAEKIKTLSLASVGEMTFIIGGSDGLSDEVKTAADFRLSFSDMTFPHMLMRVMLFEQIYRAFTIIEGSAYHK